jgi:uncharacterized damage-inducible protein DinB
MTLKEILLGEFDREVARSRRALAQVPDGKYEWKPHDRSMILGYLAEMIATIPSWITKEITTDSLDIAPADGPKMKPEPKTTSAALIAALDQMSTEARAALQATTDDHLQTTWQLKARGAVVQEAPRYQMIQETFSHWSHHRGQMTVYLRLMGAKVPALFGPSADENSFA